MKKDINISSTMSAIDINNEIAQFESNTTLAKPFNEAAKLHKDNILSYVKENPELFGTNKSFSMGKTTVTKSVVQQVNHNPELVTLSWLEAFLDTSSAEAIDIKIDPKKLNLNDPKTATLLSKIDFEILNIERLTVKMK